MPGRARRVACLPLFHCEQCLRSALSFEGSQVYLIQ